MTELDRLAADLHIAGEQAQKQSYKAVVVEARHMKDEWRSIVGGGTFRQAASKINYDILPTGLRSITAEVGYDPEGQGKLDNIIEFGTSTHGPIHPAGERVLKGGADRLEKFLGGLDPL